MRIWMLETRLGTEDGKSLKKFECGEEYEVSNQLGRAFLSAGHAVLSSWKEKANSRITHYRHFTHKAPKQKIYHFNRLDKERKSHVC